MNDTAVIESSDASHRRLINKMSNRDLAGQMDEEVDGKSEDNKPQAVA